MFEEETKSHDFYVELEQLSRSLWPHLHSEGIPITINGKDTITDRSIAVKGQTNLKFSEPLQPLPVACGRARYIEFCVESIENVSSNASLLLGFALPGIKYDWLAKTRGTVGFDFVRSCAHEGSRIPLPLDETITLKTGDTFGIGICFENHSDELQLDCFFATHNSVSVFESRCISASHRGYFRTHLNSNGADIVISVNRGTKPFAFDLQKFQKEHATHPFYRTYLSPSLFDVHGREHFWNPYKIAQQFAFMDHYRPIEEALFSIGETSEYHLHISRLQLQTFRWQKIMALFHRQEEQDVQLGRLPRFFESKEKFESTLALENFVVPSDAKIDFSGDVATIRKQLLMALTDMRHKIIIEMLRLAAAYYSERSSLFEDTEVIRSGSFEGYIKMALFLEEAAQEPNKDENWLRFIQESAFDDLVQSNMDLGATCLGYMDPSEEDEEEVETQENEKIVQDVLTYTKASDSSSDDEKAVKMIGIGWAVRAWAAWLGAHIAGIESLLGVPPADGEKPSPIPTDTILNYVSNAISKKLKQDLSELKNAHKKELSPGALHWVLMQYLSLGFSQGSFINYIPHTYESALNAVASHFEAQCKFTSEADISSLRTDIKILSESIDHEDIIHLKNQWFLATGHRPTEHELIDVVLSQLPSALRTEAMASPPPLPTRSKTHLSSSNSEIPDADASSPENEKNPQTIKNSEEGANKDSMNSYWLIAGALGIALIGATIGATAALMMSNRTRGKRN